MVKFVRLTREEYKFVNFQVKLTKAPGGEKLRKDLTIKKL